MRPKGADHQRVAICRSLGYAPARKCASSTGVVLDNDRLTKRLGHMLADEPRHDVGRAARREGNHKGDVAVRIVSGACRTPNQREHSKE